jgi:hypothetical protein
MMALRKREFAPAPMIDGRKVMPIEQALVWAYQTELCSADETQLYGGGWNLDRVDYSTSSAWLAIADAAAARAVSPDALSIHKRVQELENGKWLDADADLTGLLASTYVSLSEAAYFEEALPKAANLVIVHARLGTVPDLTGSPQPFAQRSANGEVLVRRMAEFTHKTVAQEDISFQAEQPIRAGVTYMESRGKPTRGRYPQGSYCLVGYAPDWDEVVRERAEYLVWWLALEWLSMNLGHLDRMRVTMPELPQRPWHRLDASGELDIGSNR